jgi:hypothetical protein
VQQQVHGHLETLNAGGTLDANLKFNRAHARAVLELLQRAWGLPPKRYFPRREKKGEALVACGYKAAYWTYRNTRATETADVDPDAIEIGSENAANTAGGRYTLERWHYLNEGPSGFAIYTTEKPQHTLRIGELLAVQDTATAGAHWVIGVVRWMMVQRDGTHHIGIQTLSRDAESVSVRVLAASSGEVTAEPAFLISDPTATNGFTLIGPRGIHGADRSIEIEVGSNRLQFRMGSLRESTVEYDYFSCRT